MKCTKCHLLIFLVVKLRYISQETDRQSSGKPRGNYFNFVHLTVSKVFLVTKNVLIDSNLLFYCIFLVAQNKKIF